MPSETVGPGAPTWDRIRTGLTSPAPMFVRERVVKSIRLFFKNQGFHEVETPLFVRHPGMEPYLEVFGTTWRTAAGRSFPGFLTTSPEYAMKKLLAAGISPIYQVCKSFRNEEEASFRHNPEFTMLEWYRSEADYDEIMTDCEGLFRSTAHQVDPGFDGSWTYQGQRIELAIPWERLSVVDAFARYAGVDLKPARLPCSTLLARKATVCQMIRPGNRCFTRYCSTKSSQTWVEVVRQFSMSTRSH